MALSSVTVTIENNPYIGGIEIHSAANATELGNINKLVILRKVGDAAKWNTIASIDVSAVSDLTFNKTDILTLAGEKYSYTVDLKNGDTILETAEVGEVECWFDGLFIGDFEQQYMAGTNFKTDYMTNQSVEYVQTLNSKYPFRVSNGITDYCTGTSEGLFLELTDDKKGFKPDTYHAYTDKVLDFLRDGGTKILKTHDGHGWCVTIDSQPSKVYSDYIGMNAISFKWTEIDDFPTSGLAGE